MSRIEKSILIVIVVVALIVSGLFAVEIITSVIRGYGFVFATSRMPDPVSKPCRDLSPLTIYAETIEGSTWPEPQTLTGQVPRLSLASDQPFADHNVWLLDSRNYDGVYLYTPLPLDEDSRYERDPEYCSRIVMCTLAQWEGPKGVYHPYKEYPDFVKARVFRIENWEQWACLISMLLVDTTASSLPPIPGAILYYETPRVTQPVARGSPPRIVKYPEELLPVVRAIYPNLKIPDEAVLGSPETDTGHGSGRVRQSSDI